jgi:bifunctional non-homologous end joining protein LigD
MSNVMGPSSLGPQSSLGLEGIVSKRAASRYRSGPSRSWLKTKNMEESEFILLGTERDSDGVP